MTLDKVGKRGCWVAYSLAKMSTLYITQREWLGPSCKELYLVVNNLHYKLKRFSSMILVA